MPSRSKQHVVVEVLVPTAELDQCNQDSKPAKGVAVYVQNRLQLARCTLS